MPSYLDTNCCLIISNSIETNRLICVTETVPAKSRDFDRSSVSSQMNPFLLHYFYIINKYNLYLDIIKLKLEVLLNKFFNCNKRFKTLHNSFEITKK